MCGEFHEAVPKADLSNTRRRFHEAPSRIQVEAEKAAPQPEYPSGLQSVVQRGLKFLQLAGYDKGGGGDDGCAGPFAPTCTLRILPASALKNVRRNGYCHNTTETEHVAAILKSKSKRKESEIEASKGESK